ncbi:MAG: hypothetical protein IT454_07400 [Planctomycetes bacterium]|nr:hypothetical protein [Planctomycetota bacterium]
MRVGSRFQRSLLAVSLLGWLMFQRGASVRAGDYHVGATLDCAECHKMHFKPGLEGPTGKPEVGRLLKRDVNELCLSCHDGSQRAVDVLGRNQGHGASAVRQAGFLNHLGRSGNPATGHTLGALDIAPGSNPPWRAEDENGSGVGLNCINCHAPHAEQAERAYRNLRGDAGNNAPGAGLVTYNHERIGVNDLSRDVFVRRSLEYDEAQVDFNEPDRTDSGMARFCAGCHNVFHGQPGSDANIGGVARGKSFAQFVRHPTAGVDIGGAGGGARSGLTTFASKTNRVKVMSELGVWSTPGADVTPTCISCHKAHGNDNPFGLIFRSGRGTPTENGDTEGRAVEDLCRQCHDDSWITF